jgi:hypothetical protein
MRTSRSLAPTASRAALQETTVASSCIPSSIPQSVQVTIRDEKNLPKLVRHCNKKKFLAGFYLFKKARKLGTKNTNIFKQRRRTLRLVRKNPNRRWPGEERHLYFRRESSSVSMYASVSPSHTSGCLLRFLVGADLSFPQSPSARSA